MARETRELVVFVASPSDVTAEREAVRRAARTVNETVGLPFALRLNVVGWEQVQPALGRPQATINPLLDECDVFIGLLNKRWGSPTGTHSSGFEEEFDRAVSRHAATSAPRIGLFFAEVSADLRDDPGPELSKVLAFRRKIRDERIALYRTFTDTEHLERLAQAYLSEFVAAQAAARLRPPEGTGSPAGTAPASTADVVAGQLDEARQQLGENLQAWADLVRGQKARPDRDRLLAFALAMNQDDDVLSTHAAHRLYRRRDVIVLSMGEVTLWVRTLCVDAARSPSSRRDRVIPGWYFLPGDLRGDELARVALNPRDPGQRGALLLLRELTERPARLWSGPPGSAGNDDASVEAAAERWAALLAGDPTRGAAVDYLFDASTAADALLLDAIRVAVGDAAWGAEALAAIAATQGDPSAAVAHALARPFAPEEWAVEAVLSALPTLPASDLCALVDGRQRDERLREAAFDQLLAMPVDDPDGMAAMSAMLQASDASQTCALDRVARRVGPARRWFDLAWTGVGDETRRALNDRALAATESTDDLIARLVGDWTGLTAWDALGLQQATALADRAREMLRGDGAGFVTPTDGLLDGDDPQVVRLRGYVVGRAREAALRILAAVPPEDRTDEDVELARREAANANWVSRAQAVVTLAELGDSTDAPAIVAGAAVAHLDSDALRRALAAACGFGGRSTALELLTHDRDDLAVAGAEFLAADGATAVEELVDLLYHAAGDVRWVALAALLERLDRDAVERLLDEYPARQGSHYYNVIAGLDWHLYGATSEVEPAARSTHSLASLAVRRSRDDSCRPR